MFSTNKKCKICMLIFLFVVSFIVGMLFNIQRLGSLPLKLIQSAGGTLAMNYAYKNADISAIPVKFVFQLAGPASFEPSDWSLLKSIDHITTDADFATMMTGVRITDEMMASKEYLPYIYSVSPTYLVDANSVPTLMGYGLIDHCVPTQLKYPLIDALKENSVPYDYVEFPKSNHGMYNDIDKLQEFINLSLEYCDKYFDK